MPTTFTTTSGAVTSKVDIDLSGLRGAVADLQESVKERARVIIEDWADEVTAWMKKNAPWKDRTEAERERLGVKTPHARDVLGVLVDFKENVIEIVLTGGVFYMKYLEIFFKDASGHPRFAVLKPAMDVWAQVLIDRLGAERD
jgi:hypothetical protein